MKRENISDAIGALPDDIIEESARARETKVSRPYAKIAKYAALAAVFALCIVGVRFAPSLMPPANVETTPPIISPDENPDMYSESPTEAPTEAPIDNPNNSDWGTGGGFTPCMHSLTTENGARLDFSYHSYDGHLLGYVSKYIGEDKINAWIDDIEANKNLDEYTLTPVDPDSYCPYYKSIVDFVNDFNISREVFELILFSVPIKYDYNVDAIYGGKEAAEKYYSSDRTQEIKIRKIISNLKTELTYYAETNDPNTFKSWIASKSENGWYGTVLLEKATEKFETEKRDMSLIPVDMAKFNGANNLSHYSLIELIRSNNIPREKVEEAYSIFKNNAGFEGDFDLDALYAAEFDEEYFKTTSPLEVDMQFFTYEGKN